MFCSKNQWEATNFPPELFHDSKSKRGRVLMHSKVRLSSVFSCSQHRLHCQMILGTFNDTSSSSSSAAGSSRRAYRAPSDSEDEADSGDDEQAQTQSSIAGWVYVGSHNFTPAAWGNLSGTLSKPSLNVSSPVIIHLCFSFNPSELCSRSSTTSSASFSRSRTNRRSTTLRAGNGLRRNIA